MGHGKPKVIYAFITGCINNNWGILQQKCGAIKIGLFQMWKYKEFHSTTIQLVNELFYTIIPGGKICYVCKKLFQFFLSVGWCVKALTEISRHLVPGCSIGYTELVVYL